MERPQQPFLYCERCSRTEKAAAGFKCGGPPPPRFFFLSSWCALPSRSPFHRSHVPGRWYRSTPPARLAQVHSCSLSMTVATRHVSSQMERPQLEALDGRGPVLKTIVLRTCSPMLVRMYVSYVRRERGSSAVMAIGPARMDKYTVCQTPAYVYVRYQGHFCISSLFKTIPLTEPERPSLGAV